MKSIFFPTTGFSKGLKFDVLRKNSVGKFELWSCQGRRGISVDKLCITTP